MSDHVFTTNRNPQLMEVHHAHHPAHKKPWTEYLLEFAMLFLAVFLGFTAENIREHRVERHREEGYIRSMIKDLKTDTSKIAANDRQYTRRINNLDTLMNSFDSIDKGFSGKTWLLILEATSGFPDFIYTDGTIQQLKNAGGFRLIRNKDATDSIMAYDAEVKRALINEYQLNENFMSVAHAKSELFNYREMAKTFGGVFEPGASDQAISNVWFDHMLTHDPAAKDRLYNKLYEFRDLMLTLKDMNYKAVKQKAESLIVFLEKEYDID